MWFQRFFRKHKIHFLLVLIAIFIWLHVKTDMTYEETFPVDVVSSNTNPEYVVTNHFTKSIPVLFEGTGKNLIALRNTGITILVDFQQTSRNEFVAHLQLNNIKISPPIVNIVPRSFVEKDTLHFSLEQLRYRKVPVVPRIYIKPGPGFTLVGKLSLVPAELTISGPASKIKQIKSVRTDTLSFLDAAQDIAGTVKILDPFSGQVVCSVRMVQYSVNIQQLGERLMQDIPVQIINVPKNVKVSVIPSTISLKITGGVDVLSGITREDVLVYIDYQRYNQALQNALPAMIKIPDNISYSDVYPSHFQIRVESN
ncbi:MAG TPA: hypothetical protein ENH29_05620 [Bacteroidetes bacterium]|nr:hypothetical protein [Bacteroidota bacterium]